ncbi:hypothetical protein L195_g054531 [Trifolium pratense]|uniref:Uncharacterized protein n=1 Tax=Trifolium pratense TaxID=57577 RepID=A0A2K3KGL5_TRIPR|nr:hypothetical protein L195_g054531 [Trifolium pratense]
MCLDSAALKVDTPMQNSAERYGYGFEAFRLKLCISASSGNDNGIVQAYLQVGSLRALNSS